jgi:hypothetical protein
MSGCDSGTKRSQTADGSSPTAVATDRRLPLQRTPKRLLSAMLLAWLGWTHATVQGQRPKLPESQAGTITGVVMDPSGAVVEGASVMLLSGDPPVVVSRATSGKTGEYRLHASAGIYVVAVEAAGFARFEGEAINMGASPTPVTELTLDVALRLETRIEKVEVPLEMASAGGGTNTVVLGEHDIERMPVDPTALLDELQGLAGGPNAELYVGGFSGGKLPSRASIGEIRIKQNAYSAENDTDTGSGLIQVSTKPGTDELHSELYLYGDDSALNARNPIVPNQPGYYADGTGGSVTGPVNSKASYFAGWDQMRMEMNSAIDAQTLDANLKQTQLSYAVRSPRSTMNASSRVDLRTGTNGTVTVRYSFDRESATNGGIGQLALESQGYANNSVTQTLQMANTQLLGAKIVNDARFQYIRTRAVQTPVSTAAAIVVEGAFMGGGNDLGPFSDHQDRYELVDYVSLAKGRHSMELGGRVRVGRDANHSQANFAGEFTFPSLGAYQVTQQMTAKYDDDEIRAKGGGASQFRMNAGSPDANAKLADGSLFVQDDWKARQNLTLSYGLRFETQSNIPDHADWAPRVGFAWALGKSGGKGPPNYVVRGGAGVFYRRFGSGSALQVARENGALQQEYVVVAPPFCPGVTGVAKPACPGVPDVAQLSTLAGATAIYGIKPGFHTPYYIEESVSLDRKLGRFGTVGATYANSRGVHTQVTENVNAPLPGTYDTANPASGVRPDGGDQNIYEYASEGVFRSSRLTTNVTLRANRFTVFGSYVLRFNKSDGESDGGFPSNQYDLGVDYGRSLDDVRHTVTIGDSEKLPYGIETWGFLRALSGAPFDIVVGQDLNGDSQFNDRPAFARDPKRASVVATKWGTFDTSPIAGETIIPRDYGQGPGQFVVNLAVGKTFNVGPELKRAGDLAKGPVAYKYTVELWAESQNLLNHPNLMPPVGVVNSTLFGRSLGVTGGSSLSPDRVVDMQLSMRF